MPFTKSLISFMFVRAFRASEYLIPERQVPHQHVRKSAKSRAISSSFPRRELGNLTGVTGRARFSPPLFFSFSFSFPFSSP